MVAAPSTGTFVIDSVLTLACIYVGIPLSCGIVGYLWFRLARGKGPVQLAEEREHGKLKAAPAEFARTKPGQQPGKEATS